MRDGRILWEITFGRGHTKFDVDLTGLNHEEEWDGARGHRSGLEGREFGAVPSTATRARGRSDRALCVSRYAPAEGKNGGEGKDAGDVVYRCASNIEVNCVVWDDEPVSMTADDAMAPVEDPEERSQMDAATKWLRDLLGDGDMGTKEIRADAKQAGIAR